MIKVCCNVYHEYKKFKDPNTSYISKETLGFSILLVISVIMNIKNL